MKTNGRPTYPEGPASADLWTVQAQRSADWARAARLEARRRQRRDRVVLVLTGLLALILVTGAIVLPIWIAHTSP
jgi:hypothetical protein